MNKLISVSIIVFIFSIVGFSQELNKTITDPDLDKEILEGICNKDGLLKEPFSEWFQPHYDDYAIDTETLDKINQDHFLSSEIKLVMATWCHDSQREVPAFFKIIEYLGYDIDNLNFVAVNRQKKSPEGHIEELNINLVPTFIFYYHGVEIGRIIESPENSLEKDILEIINKI